MANDAPGSPPSTAPVEATTAPPEPAAQPVTVSDQTILPASHWQNAPLPDPIPAEDDGDADSTYSSIQSSTASLTESILQYRTIHGRTFHSERGRAQAWTPNDESQAESMDMNHHLCTLVLDGKLHLAPIPDDVEKVLDIGTGTGVWAMDFADLHPRAQVIGTDVSPMQPTWVPPNLQFQIDDANEEEWTWRENEFDFVHVRALFGSIISWPAFYKEAYRVTKPGGYIEDHEWSVKFGSDDGSVLDDSPMGQWSKVYWEGGKKFGRTFRVVEDDEQVRGMEAAGWKDIVKEDIKVPIGSWPRGEREKTMGIFSRGMWEADAEGYVLYIWGTVMGWSREEIQVYIAHLRRQVRDPNVHSWYLHRIVYARKPE
ncbi:Demethylmenaquinone methyltransferase [Rhypophila decipiens]